MGHVSGVDSKLGVTSSAGVERFLLCHPDHVKTYNEKYPGLLIPVTNIFDIAREAMETSKCFVPERWAIVP